MIVKTIVTEKWKYIVTEKGTSALRVSRYTRAFFYPMLIGFVTLPRSASMAIIERHCLDNKPLDELAAAACVSVTR